MAVFHDPDPKEIYAGDAWSQDFQIGDGDPDDDDNWTPEDISAWSGFSAQWRTEAGNADAIDLTVDTSQAASGIITVSATEAQTRAMGDNGGFDIQASSPRTRTFVRARTTWEEDFTRG